MRVQLGDPGTIFAGYVVLKDLLPADPTTVGPYKLLGRLGQGGMGVVYLARSPGGRTVAVKVIQPQLANEPGFRTRFAREVSAARNVGGMFTALVVDADTDGAMPWLATAYVAGPSLAEAVETQGPLPPESVLALAAGLAEGLQAIHAAGVVHRDMKPSNVLLAADGPRVIDFGISRSREASMLTQTGTVMGSPGYLSPEQAEGHVVGPPSDIFSLGGVLTFAATGEGPFGAGPTPALMFRVVAREPNLAALPPQVRPLIEWCLAKDPAARPTPADLLNQLDALGAGVGVVTPEWLPQPFTEALHRYVPTAVTPPVPGRATGAVTPSASGAPLTPTGIEAPAAVAEASAVGGPASGPQQPQVPGPGDQQAWGAAGWGAAAGGVAAAFGSQAYATPGFGETRVDPGAQQPGYQQPGYPQPGSPAGYAQPGTPPPGYPPAGGAGYQPPGGGPEVGGLATVGLSTIPPAGGGGPTGAGAGMAGGAATGPWAGGPTPPGPGAPWAAGQGYGGPGYGGPGYGGPGYGGPGYGGPGGPVPPGGGTAVPAKSPNQRRRLLIAAAVAIIVLAGGGTALALSGGSSKPGAGPGPSVIATSSKSPTASPSATPSKTATKKAKATPTSTKLNSRNHKGGSGSTASASPTQPTYAPTTYAPTTSAPTYAPTTSAPTYAPTTTAPTTHKATTAPPPATQSLGGVSGASSYGCSGPEPSASNGGVQFTFENESNASISIGAYSSSSAYEGEGSVAAHSSATFTAQMGSYWQVNNSSGSCLGEFNIYSSGSVTVTS